MTERERFEKWFDDYDENLELKDRDRELMFIAYKAATKAAVPEGWKLVPVEPTEQMYLAGVKRCIFASESISIIYKAMLAAAPDGDK